MEMINKAALLQQGLWWRGAPGSCLHVWTIHRSPSPTQTTERGQGPYGLSYHPYQIGVAQSLQPSSRGEGRGYREYFSAFLLPPPTSFSVSKEPHQVSKFCFQLKGYLEAISSFFPCCLLSGLLSLGWALFQSQEGSLGKSIVQSHFQYCT